MVFNLYLYVMETTHYQQVYPIVGTKIAQFRKAKKMSQEDLASKIGMSRASVVNIEKGRQHPPLHLVWQLADALEVEMAHFLPTRDEIAGKTAWDLLHVVKMVSSQQETSGLAEFMNIHFNVSNDQSTTI